MPTLKKLLCGFVKKERQTLELLTAKILSLDWRDLDIKKIKGHQNIFRVRSGKIRIIFSKNGDKIAFFSIERRSETTYKF
jgi:mRNA-degrading endonuclease RelE of RelBE toxin-antitoxin system